MWYVLESLNSHRRTLTVFDIDFCHWCLVIIWSTNNALGLRMLHVMQQLQKVLFLVLAQIWPYNVHFFYVWVSLSLSKLHLFLPGHPTGRLEDTKRSHLHLPHLHFTAKVHSSFKSTLCCRAVNNFHFRLTHIIIVSKSSSSWFFGFIYSLDLERKCRRWWLKWFTEKEKHWIMQKTDNLNKNTKKKKKKK